MIWLASFALLALGVFLSALFSGLETGFYRVSRLRLAMDARSGDRMCRWLFGLVSRPSWFVATTLVGNNVANNLTTLAIVLAVDYQFPGGGHKTELIGTLLLAPLVFVYGELIPKSLFYDAPNRLLRRSTLLVVGFGVLFAPLSLLLAGFSKLLEKLVGAPAEMTGTIIGRRHLERVLHEGLQEGLLLVGQQNMVQGVLDTATRTVTDKMIPIHRVLGVPETAGTREALRLARRHRMADVPVRRANGRLEWIGYVNVAELALTAQDVKQVVRPLARVAANESHLQALLQLRESGSRLGMVTGKGGEQMGLVGQQALTKVLFRVTT